MKSQLFLANELPGTTGLMIDIQRLKVSNGVADLVIGSNGRKDGRGNGRLLDQEQRYNGDKLLKIKDESCACPLA